MDYTDTRKERRLDGVRATVEFEFQKYNVINVSATALLIECETGFSEETIDKFRSPSNEFKLLDNVSNSEMLCRGKLIRYEDSGGKITRVALSFEPKEEHSTKRIIRTIAVGGGKGGVGKTIFSVNLAITLSQVSGKEVILVDGDFGNANCHTLLGITRTEKTIEDYLRRGTGLQEIIVPTAFNKVGLICGASDKVDALLREKSKKDGLLRDLRQLKNDYVIIDLGAGVGDDTLEIYNSADEKIIVVTPELTSLQNAYSFVKAAFFYDLKNRELLGSIFDVVGSDIKTLHSMVNGLSETDERRVEFASMLGRHRVGIIGNMIEGEKDLGILRNLQGIIKEYLNVDSAILGCLGSNPEVKQSINRITPFITVNAYSDNSQAIRKVALKIEADQKVSAAS